ncbi:hypothetical protein PMIN04_000721 [Paraphaeosphaeria minitans]|uniref:A/G-specific adenine glycosylase n=1 Tax=Paraphaeosphaeria minitans TaxID=565426 RepID=A0A9P6GSM0_9PLEO|nr:A/G-specific adenine glycosylase [Paraphaeosphaeria minitans]
MQPPCPLQQIQSAVSQCENSAHLSGHQHTICASADSKLRPSLEWSLVPTCSKGITRTYCAHTLSDYRNNRGLSIIGTPKATQGVFEAREHLWGEEGHVLIRIKSPADKNGCLKDDRYEVRSIRRKGKGIISKREIKKGEVIMLESAAIVSSAQLPLHITPNEGSELLRTAARMLPEEDYSAIMALNKPSGTTGLDAILKTNSFSCQFNDGGVGDDYFCLFAEVSRINHACQPNANAKFILRTLAVEIRALKDIPLWQEISISYGKVDLKYAERQSDWRRERFTQLHEHLEASTAEKYETERAIPWENEILEISEKEGLEVLVTEDMERMAYAYASLGKHSEALDWGHKAKQNLLHWKLGPKDTSDDLRRLEELLVELQRV